MIHLNRSQYPALKAFKNLVRRDLENKSYTHEISQSTRLIGQDYGFCNDEIIEIVNDCYMQIMKQPN